MFVTMNSIMNSIEKLEDNNYGAWVVQMKSVLIHAELWGYVCGLKVKLESDSPEKKLDFDAKDEKDLASIMLCIKASQINNVKNCVTAASAWEKLKEIHMPAGPARRVHLLRQLLYIKLTDSENMESHITKFSDLIE